MKNSALLAFSAVDFFSGFIRSFSKIRVQRKEYADFRKSCVRPMGSVLQLCKQSFWLVGVFFQRNFAVGERQQGFGQ